MDNCAPDSGLQRVPVDNLVLGMYVAALDRPWLESSNPVQGFYLQSEDDIRKLSEECSYVYVDPRRYDTGFVDATLNRVSQAHTKPKIKKRPVYAGSIRPSKPTIYNDTVELREELETAQTSLDGSVDMMKSVVGKIHNAGSIDCEEIETAIKPLVDSVMRNKVAVAALLRIRSLGSYGYMHALSCAVWAALLARELGFSQSDITRLSLGCSLMDLGKLHIPAQLLSSKEPLTPDIRVIIDGHVEAGVKLAKDAGVEDVQVLQILHTHHERHDGSGYPQGLKGTEIPVFGRIAGIVDSYDAMISERPYAKAISSFEAIQKLQSQSSDLYQREIVDRFIEAIGVFPVGTIVELNSGEVGVVVIQNEVFRLKPKLMLILDESKQARKQLLVTDLAGGDNNVKPSLWITKELPINAYDIDPGKYFL